MDYDSLAMKLAIVVITCVLVYMSYKWYKSQSIEKMEAQSNMRSPMMPEPPQDPVPQDKGITMYGNDSCPWCQKQKDYFASKEIEYTFVDCSTPGACPNFVHGFPTIVKDGNVMPGYQEL